MKLYKQIDFIIQILLFVCGVIISFDPRWLFIYSYFIVGGWQLLSVIVHLILNEKFYPASGRRNYYFSLLIIFSLGIIFFAAVQLNFHNGILIIIPFLALFVTPLMGFWYINICHTEIKTLEYKSLVHLK
jgi:hypothetical protein